MPTPHAARTPTAERRHTRTEVDDWLQRATALQEAQPRQSLLLARKALTRATGLRYASGIAKALRCLGGVHYKLGETDAAFDCFQRGLAAARRVRNTTLQSNCINGMGVILDQRGDYAQALSCFEISLGLAGGTSNTRAWVAASANIGHVLEHLGQYQAAAAHYRHTLAQLSDPTAYGVAMLQMNLGVVLVQDGRVAEALAPLEAAPAGFRLHGMHPEAVHCLCNLAHVLTALGQHARAHTLLQEALAEARALQVPPLEWRALNALGELLLLQGDAQAARAALERGLALHERHRHDELLYQGLETLSKACEAAGDLAAALAHLRRSVDVRAASMQAARQPAVQAALAHSAARLRLPPGARAAPRDAAPPLPAPPPAPRVLASPASALRLSEREVEVLRLAARGESNRAIGETLGISALTARHHVSSILAKLGASKRAEAVAIAAARGLLESPASRSG